MDIDEMVDILANSQQ